MPFPLALTLPTGEVAETDLTDLMVIGLVMNIVGTFFLANSIVFKKPRRVIQEFFRTDPGSLLAIRDYIFTKIQVVIGFLFLFCGFALMIIAHADKLANAGNFLLISIGVIIATAFLVGTIGFAYSRRSFKNYLHDFFRKNPWPFESHMDLTKEIGEIFGVTKSPDDTVDLYVAKLRKTLHAAADSDHGSQAGRPAPSRVPRSEMPRS